MVIYVPLYCFETFSRNLSSWLSASFTPDWIISLLFSLISSTFFPFTGSVWIVIGSVIVAVPSIRLILFSSGIRIFFPFAVKFSVWNLPENVTFFNSRFFIAVNVPLKSESSAWTFSIFWAVDWMLPLLFFISSVLFLPYPAAVRFARFTESSVTQR